MGWNSGYTIMEEQVIALYNKEYLTKNILETIMEPFKETDCDSGGSTGLIANDGKNIEQVICFIMEPEGYIDVMENPKWAEGYEEKCWENNDKAYDLFYHIWNKEFGIY